MRGMTKEAETFQKQGILDVQDRRKEIIVGRMSIGRFLDFNSWLAVFSHLFDSAISRSDFCVLFQPCETVLKYVHTSVVLVCSMETVLDQCDLSVRGLHAMLYYTHTVEHRYLELVRET